MQSVRQSCIYLIICSVIIGFNIHTLAAGVLWYELYKAGLEAEEKGQWEQARNQFEEALKYENKDSAKKRIGTMFIKYFPHRELGICYYNLGNMVKAREHLSISLGQQPTSEANQYLASVESNMPPGTSPAETSPRMELAKPEITNSAFEHFEGEQPEPHQLVGDRMCIAVLPFETKGIGEELGEIDLLDKLITEFVHLNRFKVIERSQLEKILQEQKLGLTGIIDASTAVEVGKTAGVDAVVFGSIASDKRAVTIDARLVDTETAEIITSRDAFSKNLSLLNLSQMISEVAQKIRADLPVANGLVIRTDDGMLVDLGSGNGVRKGMKCTVYREGAPIIHPVSGDTLDTQKQQICEIQLTDVFDGYSKAKVIKHDQGTPAIGDKVQTR